MENIYVELVDQLFSKKRILKNFAKFMGKHTCRTLLLSKVCDLRPVTLAQGLLSKFCKVLKNTYFLKHLRAAASLYCQANITHMKNLLEGNLLYCKFIWFNMSELQKQKKCFWFLYKFKMPFIMIFKIFNYQLFTRLAWLVLEW